MNSFMPSTGNRAWQIANAMFVLPDSSLHPPLQPIQSWLPPLKGITS